MPCSVTSPTPPTFVETTGRPVPSPRGARSADPPSVTRARIRRTLQGAAADRDAVRADRILPAQPVRQYVLAFPYEISGLAATRPDVLRALSRIFWESLRRRYLRWAKKARLPNAHTAGTGAVTGVHRAGSTLNVHTHFHVLVVDGVYVHRGDGQDDDAVTFESAPPPSRDELQAMLEHIYARTMRWLERHHPLRDADESNAPAEMSPAETLTSLGMERGTLVTMRDGDQSAGDAANSDRKRAGLSIR